MRCTALYWLAPRRRCQVRAPHIKDGVAEIQTEKTGQWAYFLMEPELLDSIAASPCGELTFIAGERGRPMAKESFGNWFSSAARTAGIKKSAHGLRKSGATRDAERGFTESELEAKYAWDGRPDGGALYEGRQSQAPRRRSSHASERAEAEAQENR